MQAIGPTDSEAATDRAATFASAAPDLGDLALQWLSRLVGERRLSPHTIEAYARDLRQFLDFLAGHFGDRVDVAAFSALTPADIRAFMARRRSSGVESRSLLRNLAGVRSFARHLERSGAGKASAFSAIRTPKLARTLPKPLTSTAARAVASAESRAGETRPQWALARDAAVFALLYGAGLRISEALSIRRHDAPVGLVDSLTVIGKGSKMRSVPIIAPAGKAIEAYLALCPVPMC
jgi:integrase/recombinase XerC